ncbi:MAG: LysR family transcriptional regulator [Caulobacter sp.]
MDRLGQLQTLVAIVECRSLTQAAKRLGRSAPAVTRDLADLERRVGAMLIERSTRRCKPTPAGLRLAERGRQLVADYEEALGQSSGEASIPAGHLRVTAPSRFGETWVAPLVLSFLDAHPAVTIDLRLTDRLVDLVQEDFDLAVRIGRLADSDLVRRPASELRRLLVASPAYLKARGTPQRPEDLRMHDLIHHTDHGPGAPWVFKNPNGGELMLPLHSRLAVNSPAVGLAAAREGRGVVAVLSSQVGDDLRRGRLQCVLEAFEPEPLAVNLVYPPSRRGWLRLRLLADHLARGLQKAEG